LNKTSSKKLHVTLQNLTSLAHNPNYTLSNINSPNFLLLNIFLTFLRKFPKFNSCHALTESHNKDESFYCMFYVQRRSSWNTLMLTFLSLSSTFYFPSSSLSHFQQKLSTSTKCERVRTHSRACSQNREVLYVSDDVLSNYTIFRLFLAVSNFPTTGWRFEAKVWKNHLLLSSERIHFHFAAVAFDFALFNSFIVNSQDFYAN
jgi:hypothetical protein